MAIVLRTVAKTALGNGDRDAGFVVCSFKRDSLEAAGTIANRIGTEREVDEESRKAITIHKPKGNQREVKMVEVINACASINSGDTELADSEDRGKPGDKGSWRDIQLGTLTTGQPAIANEHADLLVKEIGPTLGDVADFYDSHGGFGDLLDENAAAEIMETIRQRINA